MDTLRRSVRNILGQLGSQAVTWASTLLFTAALGRFLGDDGFGVLYLALAITGIFGMLVDFGLQPLVTREIARRPDLAGQYLLYAAAIKLAVWVPCAAAIYGMAHLLGYPAQTRTVLMIYTLTMGTQAISYLFYAVFRGMERLGPVAIASVLEKGLNVALGVALLATGAGVVAMAWVLLAGALAGLVWQAALLLPRLDLHRLRWDTGFARGLLAASAPFAVYWFLSNFYWRIDAIMLSQMLDQSAVGAYGAAYRLFDTMLFLPNIIAASVLMPVMARLSGDARGSARVALEKGLNLLLLAGIPIAAGTIVLAGPILDLVYGREEFQAAAPALRALGAGILVLYVNSALGWALISQDMERRLFVIPAVALALNVALNLVMIPRWGGGGAATATVLCELLIGAAYLRLLPRDLIPWRSLAIAIRAGVAAAGMVAVLVALRGTAVPLLVLTGAAVYLALALALHAVPREDLALLRRALRRGGTDRLPAATPAGGDAV